MENHLQPPVQKANRCQQVFITCCQARGSCISWFVQDTAGQSHNSADRRVILVSLTHQKTHRNHFELTVNANIWEESYQILWFSLIKVFFALVSSMAVVTGEPFTCQHQNMSESPASQEVSRSVKNNYVLSIRSIRAIRTLRAMGRMGFGNLLHTSADQVPNCKNWVLRWWKKSEKKQNKARVNHKKIKKNRKFLAKKTI